ncbi:MAG: ATP-binding cassette domain-containing protein, partial [Burkholderiaceae bacterium]|nr:ATP-binding cassette domain-containing protein [Burkholderiaceae bacterium]
RHYTLARESVFQPAPKVRALNGVDLTIAAGRSLGVVGESGSGKSTLARLAMALEKPTAGTVRLLGRDLNALDAEALRRVRADFQMVFQDPYGSLDPRQKVVRIVAEPLAAQGGASRAEQRRRVGETLEAVGLRAADLDKYPHEFSGGQRQRIAIARAIVTRPKLVVADEPVSALDVSVQAQVLNLLLDLQRDFGITYLLISHDLAVVDHICAEVAVIYLGRIVEQGAPELLFHAAAHPYTQALLAAVPRAQPGVRRQRAAAAGAASQMSPAADERAPAAAAGCSFADRCPFVTGRCRAEAPLLRAVQGGHLAACHHAERVMAQGLAAARTRDVAPLQPVNPT